MSSTLVQVIQMRDYGRRVRAGIRAQEVHDQIAQVAKDSRRVRLDFANVESVGASFLDRSLGALVARHGATILRSIVSAHCGAGVEASIVNAFRQEGMISGNGGPATTLEGARLIRLAPCSI